MSLDLTSKAFDGGVIPKKFTCDGPDISPALAWTDPPEKTASFALTMTDPDAPAGTWVHWVMYNLPADARELTEGIPKVGTLPDGSRQGRNDFGKLGYNGPCPPKGRPHRYFLTLYALDFRTNPGPGISRSELEHAIRGHVLARAEVMGTFQH
jgi:Raf kinase inhibitor-like YbhB/YbcL family protein